MAEGTKAAACCGTPSRAVSGKEDGDGSAFREKVEGILALGGMKKDIALLVVSGAALVASLVADGAGAQLPFDPAWIAIVLSGIPIIVETGLAVVYDHDIKADLLVSLALIASVATGEYFAAGEVAAIMQLGGLLEDLTAARARAGMERLVALTPREARIVSADGAEEMAEATAVKQGMLVRVLPGEAIPVDGTIVEGVTSIDESVMTGEPMPRDKGTGDAVMSGTQNQFGAILVRADRAGEDSSIQRMVRLVEGADAGKAKIVRLADSWATWIVVGALSLAVLAFLLTGEIMRSVTVLVVFCPCSLVLATPTAVVAAIGNATRHDFLVKEGDALERLAQVKSIAFDKTGTLTKGKPAVSELRALPESGLDDRELAALVASAELRSEHPLGQAAVAYTKAAGIEVPEPDSFSMVPGRGVAAHVAGHEVLVGNAQMMAEEGVAEDAAGTFAAEGLLHAGKTVSYVVVDGKPAGIVALSDELRPESAELVACLRREGIASVLLTGDSETAAQSAAKTLSIDEVKAACRPEDKLAYISSHEGCAMVGDGINDAPALKRSFVGIAMGGIGSDIAMDAADIVLTKDGIDELPHLVALSHHMMRTIKRNLTFSMCLNFVAVALAMLAVLDPVTGALVHNAGSVFVVVSSGMLLGWEERR
ncbi:MAG: heavy metal translocating P-type ATPase [Atopobiaceae bacterium]